MPSLVAAHDASGALRWGWDAAAVRHEPGWTVLPSVKRLLSDAGPSTEVALGRRRLPIATLLEGFFSALHRELVARSNAGIAANDAITAAVSVPANASTAQRFLTLEAFKGGGFARGRAPERAFGRGVRVRAPEPARRPARAPRRLRPRGRHVRRVAPEDDGEDERGRRDERRPAPRRRRLRRGDPRARPREGARAGGRRGDAGARPRGVRPVQGVPLSELAALSGGPLGARQGASRPPGRGRLGGLRPARRADARGGRVPRRGRRHRRMGGRRVALRRGRRGPPAARPAPPQGALRREARPPIAAPVRGHRDGARRLARPRSRLRARGPALAALRRLPGERAPAATSSSTRSSGRERLFPRPASRPSS